MRRQPSNLWTPILLILALCFAGAAGAVSVDPTLVSWDAEPGYRLTLTVSGPGDFHLRQDFAPGEAPSFGAIDDAGASLADGVYVWELTTGPVKAAARSDASAAVKGFVHSGTFSLAGGAFLSPQALEEVGGAEKDQVILDDLIVDGSICAGLDCVNGESFGFDTIRIKENNLRIRAVDTSSTSSFPTRDWQLTFNDSANGGQDKFSIDDIDGGRTPFTIEGNAPSHALYVDNGGRVGFGTSTPVADLHVKSGNTPTLRLEQDGASGFTPQTWDLAGNEANLFIRDATNGSTLPIRLRPGAPTSSLDIAADGNVGIGTSSPSEEIHVQRTSGNAAIRLENSLSSGTADFIIRSQGAVEQLQIRGTNIAMRIGQAAQQNLLHVGVDATGNVAAPTEVNITGSLFINGVDNSNPDYVFEPGYELESIEEHARYMWEKKYLPAVGAGVDDETGKAVIDVANRSQGILEELEKAHIYIEQLHQEIQEIKARLAESEAAEE